MKTDDEQEQKQEVAMAMRCAESGDATHWPTVAAILAEEVKGLRCAVREHKDTIDGLIAKGIQDAHEIGKLKSEIECARAAVAGVDRLRMQIAAAHEAFPIGFYPDESLASRVRIMRQHWEKLGDTMQENSNLRIQVESLNAQLSQLRPQP